MNDVDQLMKLMLQMQSTNKETLDQLRKVVNSFTECSKCLQAMTVQNNELREMIHAQRAHIQQLQGQTNYH